MIKASPSQQNNDSMPLKIKDREFTTIECEVFEKVPLSFANKIVNTVVGMEIFFDVVDASYAFHTGVIEKDLDTTVLINTKNGYSNRKKSDIYIKKIVF
ncbi:MAG: hypothetical protein PHW62_00935 [Candidatus Ratteibacteria bacterium]|nr:hypothetical protein [Candidatus Ratteibacteria bacterium]